MTGALRAPCAGLVLAGLVGFVLTGGALLPLALLVPCAALRVCRRADEPAPGAAAAAALALLVLLLWSFAALRAADAPSRPLPVPAATEPPPATPFVLDAGDAVVLPRPPRDVELRLVLRFAPDSTLQVRLRAPDPDRAEGVSLLIGVDPRLPNGFVRETDAAFTVIGHHTVALPTAFPEWPLRVQVAGDRFHAFADGQPVASAWDSRFGAGHLVLLAARGRVAVRSLEVVPLAAPPPPPAGIPWARVVPAPLLLALALASVLLAGRRPAAALADAAWGGLPLAVALGATPPAGVLADLLRCGLVAAGALLLLAPLLARRGRVAPFSWFVLVPLALVPACGTLRLLPALPPARPDDVRDWSGRRLEEEVAWLTHPALRLGNPYLARHRLSGRPLAPPRPGAARVAVLHGGEAGVLRVPGGVLFGRPVDVVDAGWEDATLTALLRFLRDVLLPLEPDVVVLVLEEGMARGLAELDVEAYLARVGGERYRRTLIDRLAETFGWLPQAAPADQLAGQVERVATLLAPGGARLIVTLGKEAGPVAAAAARRAAERSGIVLVEGIPALTAAVEDALLERHPR